MYSTRSSLAGHDRAQANELLNELLAASINLSAQPKQRHRNIRGPTFIPVTALFDRILIDLYTGVSRRSDEHLRFIELPNVSS